MDRAIFSSHANAKLRHDSNKNVTYALDLGGETDALEAVL
jgi:hypothetical protein